MFGSRSGDTPMMAPPVAIINHHYCHPDGHGFVGLRGITPGELDANVHELTAAGIPVRSLNEVLAGAGHDGLSVVFTFDDGLKDLKDHVLPVLRKHRVPATFFVSSIPYTDQRLLHVHRVHLLQGALGCGELGRRVRDSLRGTSSSEVPRDDERYGHLYPHDDETVRTLKIDLNYRLPYSVVDPMLQTIVEDTLGDEAELVRRFYLSRGEIEECLEAGLDLGLHSHSHPVMSRLSQAQQREEIRLCRKFVRETFGQDSVAFSYPYGVDGTYDARTVRLVAEDPGIVAGLTLARRVAEAADLESRWTIPRLDNRDVFGFDGRLRREALEMASSGT